MSIENFRSTSSEAGDWASEGWGKLALVPRYPHSPPDGPRPSSGTGVSAAEQVLIDHVVAYVQAAQPCFSRSLILRYYSALKVFPIVAVVAPQRRMAAELSRLVAEAIVGCGSGQFAVVSNNDWLVETGENAYYRTVHDRYSSLRCQSLLQEAADSGNIGKAFFACFELLPTAIHLVDGLASLSSVAPSLAISLALTPNEVSSAMARLSCAALIEIRTPAVRETAVCVNPMPPMVGYQRLWLRARARRAPAMAAQPMALVR